MWGSNFSIWNEYSVQVLHWVITIYVQNLVVESSTTLVLTPKGFTVDIQSQLGLRVHVPISSCHLVP